MDQAHRARLERVYAEHPVAADAVLNRLRSERGTLDGIRARDLAEAPNGGPTDQNHVGGAAAVRDLAAAVGIQPGWAVLDIGTGLGGTPRLLAEEFHCRCHGVELTANRVRDAVRLTHLVGLDERVTFSQGDFMSVNITGDPFDLAIGQATLMHLPDLPAALDRVAAQLRPRGKLAVEDAIIAEQPSTPEGRRAFDRLLHHWNGQFQTRDNWHRLLDGAGFRADRMDDMTGLAIHDFEKLLADTDAARLGGVTADEREGWALGLRFVRSGHLRFVRIVATRSRAAMR